MFWDTWGKFTLSKTSFWAHVGLVYKSSTILDNFFLCKDDDDKTKFASEILLGIFFSPSSWTYCPSPTSKITRSNGLALIEAFCWSAISRKCSKGEQCVKRGGLSNAFMLCPLCKESGESIDHMFMHCTFFYAISCAFLRLFRIVRELVGNL